MLKFLLVGGSGLVGSEAAKILTGISGAQITALVRRPGAVTALLPAEQRSRIREVVFDFAQQTHELTPDVWESLRSDVLICAVGTTIKKAGSKAAFRAVDLDIPLSLIQIARRMTPPPVFALVSATGAEHGIGFYLGIKAKVEAALKNSGLRSIVARPSLLLGTRAEHRLGEALASKLTPPVFQMLDLFGLKQNKVIATVRPIPGAQVARALIRASIAAIPQRNASSMSVLEGPTLFAAGENSESFTLQGVAL